MTPEHDDDEGGHGDSRNQDRECLDRSRLSIGWNGGPAGTARQLSLAAATFVGSCVEEPGGRENND
jgi:hypothetical protein